MQVEAMPAMLNQQVFATAVVVRDHMEQPEGTVFFVAGRQTWASGRCGLGGRQLTRFFLQIKGVDRVGWLFVRGVSFVT